MNILHVSDLHFGPRHWDGDDQSDRIWPYSIADTLLDPGYWWMPIKKTLQCWSTSCINIK